jgi:hypothetical protein
MYVYARLAVIICAAENIYFLTAYVSRIRHKFQSYISETLTDIPVMKFKESDSRHVIELQTLLDQPLDSVSRC